MTNEEILEGLKEVVKMVKPKIDLDGVTGNTLLVEELGLDSLTMILVVMALEAKYNIQIDPQIQPKTVNDVCEYIAGKLAA